jgi:hypothetical protein
LLSTASVLAFAFPLIFSSLLRSFNFLFLYFKSLAKPSQLNQSLLSLHIPDYNREYCQNIICLWNKNCDRKCHHVFPADLFVRRNVPCGTQVFILLSCHLDASSRIVVVIAAGHTTSLAMAFSKRRQTESQCVCQCRLAGKN